MRNTHLRSTVLGAALLSSVLAALPASAQQSCTTKRLSTTSSGAEATGHSRYPTISADKNWVAFESTASDLVAGDTNDASDVFMKNVTTGELTLVSRGLGGIAANGPSDHATVSGNGEWVVFESEATNLVVNDTNGVRDVFLFERATGDITRVSAPVQGGNANGPSGQAGLLKGSDISHDGNRIVFQSLASNLVGGDTNLSTDIFVFDRATQQLFRVTAHAAGQQANGTSQDPSISADGSRVAFMTWATNLVVPDTNGTSDILVVHVDTAAFVRASRDTAGAQADDQSARPVLSADGSSVAFESFATNLVVNDTNAVIDVFVHDLSTGSTERVSIGSTGQQGTHYAYRASISADGNRVAFTSASGNLTPGGNGIQSVYLRDRALATTERWGQDSAGNNGFAGSGDPDIAASGDQVVFMSLAALVPQDTNGAQDIYVRSCGPTGVQYCHGSVAACPCGNASLGLGGCVNSIGSAAQLDATGTASVFADTVTLHATGILPNSPTLLFQGFLATGGGFGVPFGDGLRCVGGNVLRLGTRLADATGTLAFGASMTGDPLVSVKGIVPAVGGLRFYQAWYRDTAPFCTPDGFNLTNGYSIGWAP